MKELRQQNKAKRKKFCCWVSDKDEVLSFTYTKGYKIKEFESRNELLEYSYLKTYKGYRVQ